MLLKKTDPPESDEAIDVLVEPRDPADREEVVKALEDLGARRVRKLSGDFVSAQLTAAQIEAVRERAHVHVKRPSQLRPRSP
ncbi:MAG: hypothetical protein V3T72_06010 [Thermoanaerobaculia bacterium]